MLKNNQPFRDGKIHICKEMCATCIFRPGNLMHLSEGRLASMIKDATEAESCIPCHSTLYENGPEAVCFGFFKQHPTLPLQLALTLNLIEWQDSSSKSKSVNTTASVPERSLRSQRRP